MRITVAVCKRGIDFRPVFYNRPRLPVKLYRRQWEKARKQTVKQDTATVSLLHAHGFSVIDDPWEHFKDKPITAPPTPTDSVEFPHPDWHERRAILYHPRSGLVAGLAQAQLLTKTVLPGDAEDFTLPTSVTQLQGKANIPHQDELVKKAILHARLLQATQIKLPKKIDLSLAAEQKMHINLPRNYGIPLRTQNHQANRAMLRLCESLAPLHSKALNRSLLFDARFKLCLEVKENLVVYDTKNNYGIFLLTDAVPLAAFADTAEVAATEHTYLPDIFPVDETVNLWRKNIYKAEDVFPVSGSYIHPFVHTIIVPCNDQGTQRHTADSFYARALMHSFIAAAAQAKHRFGNSVGVLPTPVCLHCIQMDGEKYQFSVFQLNTLDLSTDDGVKNMYWTEEWDRLYDVCDYIQDQPTLEGYNPKIMEKFLSFYLNGAM